jgi:hypothetical protein
LKGQGKAWLRRGSNNHGLHARVAEQSLPIVITRKVVLLTGLIQAITTGVPERYRLEISLRGKGLEMNRFTKTETRNGHSNGGWV